MPYHGVRGDFLLGLVTNGDGYCLEERTLGGCPFCVLSLPRVGLRRRIALRRGLRELKKRRVRRCVFPADFLERERCSAHGIEEVDVLPLLRQKAGEWTRMERQTRGLTGSVAVAADRLTEEAANAVGLLLESMGSVSLLRVQGAEELQRQLRRESGAVLRLLSPQQLTQAETLLDFASFPGEGQKLTLRLNGEMLPCFLLPEELRCQFPEDTDHAGLAAALWELGKVETKRIGLKSRM